CNHQVGKVLTHSFAVLQDVGDWRAGACHGPRVFEVFVNVFARRGDDLAKGRSCTRPEGVENWFQERSRADWTPKVEEIEGLDGGVVPRKGITGAAVRQTAGRRVRLDETGGKYSHLAARG